jgi:hypothetical protein
MEAKRVSARPSTADRGTRPDRRVSVTCRSSRPRRTIARTALASRTRNSLSKSYSIPASQHEPDDGRIVGRRPIHAGRHCNGSTLSSVVIGSRRRVQRNGLGKAQLPHGAAVGWSGSLVRFGPQPRASGANPAFASILPYLLSCPLSAIAQISTYDGDPSAGHFRSPMETNRHNLRTIVGALPSFNGLSPSQASESRPSGDMPVTNTKAGC